MVLFEIAELANASRIVRSFWMWAIVSCLFSSELMVALRAHSLCVENFSSVRTVCYCIAASFFFLLDLLWNLIVVQFLVASRALLILCLVSFRYFIFVVIVADFALTFISGRKIGILNFITICNLAFQNLINLLSVNNCVIQR